ncbi:LysM peptidoglycan-binding domain-containing protein [Streptomyces sp. IBSNAI002]|uniref:LysM peptidoglycan-binding domain-containing protein n=1 Tax=Streptomyces sp. IBSNAI002 TaxID=3457500 RepID=UPI003FD1973D
MPSNGKHRRPDNNLLKRRLAAAGTGLALPVIVAGAANAATKAPATDATLAATHQAPRPDASTGTAKSSADTQAAPKHRTHVVKAGETLSGIACQEHVSLSALHNANKAEVPNENLIHVGLTLTIPGGDATTAPADAPAPAHHAAPHHHQDRAKAHHGEHKAAPQHAKPHAKPEAKPHTKPATKPHHQVPQTPPSPDNTPQPQTPSYPNNLDGWIRQSLSIMKAHGIPGSYEGIMRNVMRESSGNPKAINLWDSNAKAGIPSKGLLQVIDPTFRAYHVPGTSFDPYDPVANITAACNYAAAKYVSINNVNGAY